MPEKDDPLAPSGEPDPFTPPDDPFAAAFGPAPSPSEPLPLARRDPDAPLEESSEYLVTGAVSFDEVLRRARRQGFLAGTAAGALAGAAVAVGLALFTSSSGVATRESVAEPRVVIVEGARPAGPPARSGWRSRPPAERPVPIASPRARPELQGAAAEAPPPVPRAAVDEAVVPPAAEGSQVEARAPAQPVAGALARAAEVAAAGPEAEVGLDLEPPAGTVDAREVAAALRARRRELDACVAAMPGDAGAARGPGFWLSIVIAPTGRVSEVRIDDPEIEATPVGECLVRLARTMSFAPFQGEPVSVKLALEYGSAE